MTNYVNFFSKKNVFKKNIFFKFMCFIFCVTMLFNANDASALTLATSGDYEPYEFYKSGELVGIDIDLCKELEKETNLTIKVVDTGDFDSLVDDVVNGKYDGIIAGLDETSERNSKMSKTISYHDGMVIYFQKGSKYVDEFNDAIKELKSNGTIEKIVKKYK